MQVVAKQKAVVVSATKANCEVLVKQIVQDKRSADEQERQVNAEAEKIGKEAAEANEIARVVQGELDKALPALQAAEDALNVLTKKDISELKAYAKPPGLVELTLQGALPLCEHKGLHGLHEPLFGFFCVGFFFVIRVEGFVDRILDMESVFHACPWSCCMRLETANTCMQTA